MSSLLLGQLTGVVVTVSDSVSQGTSEDKSGPAVAAALRTAFPSMIVHQEVVADDRSAISALLLKYCDATPVSLVLTSGGTGFTARDVTPEATKDILDKEAPGLVVAMLSGSLGVTPMAALSRPAAGIRKSTLIINLPGSPKGALENLEFVRPALAHALQLVAGIDTKVHPGLGATSQSSASSSSSGDAAGGAASFSHHGEPGHYCSAGCFHSDLPPAGTRKKRGSKYPMISMEAATQLVSEALAAISLGTESIDVREGLGRVLAVDVRAQEPIPSFRAAIKDGYAVLASDGLGDFPVVGTVTAGHVGAFTVNSGTVAKIATGAPLPPGTDAVIMIENTELLSSHPDGTEAVVRILRGAKGAGDEVRQIGSDTAVGELVGQAGHIMSATDIGLFASLGVTRLEVVCRPRIGVMSTGDEIVEHTQEPAYGQVRDANRLSLLSCVAENGCEAVDLGIAPDSREELEQRLVQAFNTCDIVLTSGGVSMGDRDLVKPILEARGKIHFGNIRMKPGKPTTFATVEAEGGRRCLVFGLPGNPVSCVVTFNLFVVPSIRSLSRWRNPTLPRVQVVLGNDVHLDAERVDYQRVSLSWGVDGRLVGRTTGNQISSRLASMSDSQALLELPQGKGIVTAGTVVNALLVGPLSVVGL